MDYLFDVTRRLPKKKPPMRLRRNLSTKLSNASDALDKLRFLSVTKPSLLGDVGELKISIKPDSDNGTITITISLTPEIHEGLDFSADGEDDEFGIFSIKFSIDGRELVAACSDASIHVYDLQGNKVSLQISAHMINVNTVCFADESGHLIYSGSDDDLCKFVVSTKSRRSDKQYVWNAAAESSSYVIREETNHVLSIGLGSSNGKCFRKLCRIGFGII